MALKPLLVLDVGTTSSRASLVTPEGGIRLVASERTPPSRPAAGVSEFDAAVLAATLLRLAGRAAEVAGGVDGVAIANQRASTVLFDRRTGAPVGPGLGWQDLRTVGQCLQLQSKGLRLAPNQSATKLAYLRSLARDRSDLGFATLDSWAAWQLSGGAVHRSDATNAAVTGLTTPDATAWDEEVRHLLDLDGVELPELSDSSGPLGAASALPGSPPIVAMVGDQQASLIGQGCREAGQAKATFGTGGMLDMFVGAERPDFSLRGPSGSFPIVASRLGGSLSWGIEAIMLAAGTCVEWLRDGLGCIASVEESGPIAASVRDSGGVAFIPAFGGLGTPLWDFGAKGALLGLDAATGRAEIVHAVLDGIANCGADLLESAEADAGREVERLYVDGGMSANTTFVQLLANATGKVVVPCAHTEATTAGAAMLGGLALGWYRDLEEASTTVRRLDPVEPSRRSDRARWREMRERARRTVPFLSALEF